MGKKTQNIERFFECYDTGNIVEFIAFDGENGEIVKDAQKPEKAKYKKGELISAEEKENQFTTVVYYN